MQNRKHAVVIGGSMAGLLAARVLRNHYDQVTICERDCFPEVGENRRGVPQGRHTHGLLASGREVLERHFPGITAELVAAGAVSRDMVMNARWHQSGGYLARCNSGLTGVVLSRPLLEGMVRRRLLALDGITARQECTVESLAVSDDKSTVTGIRLGGETLSADLVVDTAGRGSHAPDWLQAIGFPAPEVEKVEVGIAYTTRRFRRDPASLGGDIVVVIPATPEGKRGGVMLAQEGDCWTVTLFGHFGQNAPPDLAGFIEFARTLPHTDIYDTIRNAEPLGDALTARFPVSVRRRYERLTQFPKGFLVFGDAICSFNPIYGQGMSAAALQSVELDTSLASGVDGLSSRFFARAAKLIDIPWSIAVGNDLRMPETVGPRSPQISFINWYMCKLHKAAHRDPVLAMAFHRVANLLAAPASVMHPSNAWRVIRGNLFGRSSEPERSSNLASAAGQN